VLSDGPTATGPGPYGSTAPSGGLTTLAREAHYLTDDHTSPTTAPSSEDAEDGGQTASLGDPTASSCSPTIRLPAPISPMTSSCRISASSSANGISSTAGIEEDTDDDLLDYEPSLVHDSMEINVIYLSSIDYSLLEEEEVSQLALGPQDVVFKKLIES
jgi:hypothetical protein